MMKTFFQTSTYKKILSVILICIVTLPVLTSCYDYHELESMSMIMGTAVDGSTFSGNYVITSEVAQISTSEGSPKLESTLLTSEGNTIYSASRNAVTITGKRPFYGHSNIIIVSQEIAEEGIIPVMDFALRNDESRVTTYFLVSGEETAAEILKCKPFNDPLVSSEIEKILEARHYLSQYPRAQLYEMVNTFYQKGNCMVLPLVNYEETDINEDEKEGDKKAFNVSGCALFRDDKMIGKLDDFDTKMLLFARDEVEGGTLSDHDFNFPDDKNISLKIIKSKTKIKPVDENGDLKIKMNIDIKVSVSEVGNDSMETFEMMNETLPDEAGPNLAQNIHAVIRKIQTEHQADVLNFSDIIKSNLPNIWREIEESWDQVFKNLPVEVTCKITMDDSKMSNGTIRYTR